jgi:phosphatidate cytidylyltransferase
MLFWRLVFGPILIMSFVGLLWADLRLGPRAPLLALLVALIAIRMSWEYARLLQVRSFRLNWHVLALLASGVVLANWFPIPGLTGMSASLAQLGPPMLVFGLALMLLFTRAMYHFEQPGTSLENLGAEVLGLCYIAILTSTTAQLRWVGDGLLGYIPLASLVVTVKCGDTSAFFVGRALGGARMAPRISPGKTVSGGIAALVGGMLGGCLWLRFALPGLTGQPAGPLWALLLYGLLIALAGMLGDLAESLIKRDVGQKDAPPLFPGFGGLLDVVDSVLFCGPLALLLWNVLPLVKAPAPEIVRALLSP